MGDVRRNRPVTLLVKPASAGCNLRCMYCFYAELAGKRSVYQCGVMNGKTRENLLRAAFQDEPPLVSFLFQGGEPMLAGLDFFKRWLEDADRLCPNGTNVNYSIQTNGTLIDDGFASLFQERRFLVGVSLDGKADAHNEARRDGAGNGTFRRVTEGIHTLKRHGVDFNILSVVTKRNCRKIRETYAYFKSQSYRYLQFIPCISSAGFEMNQEEMYRFLTGLFGQWRADAIKGDVVSIRNFDNYIAILRGGQPENCGMCGVCGNYYAVESDGSVYPCDFYCTDEWKLGNVNDGPFSALNRQLSDAFVNESRIIPEDCAACPYFALCRNGCKNDRTAGKNRYCEAYRAFFREELGRLKELADRGC